MATMTASPVKVPWPNSSKITYAVAMGRAWAMKNMDTDLKHQIHVAEGVWRTYQKADEAMLATGQQCRATQHDAEKFKKWHGQLLVLLGETEKLHRQYTSASTAIASILIVALKQSANRNGLGLRLHIDHPKEMLIQRAGDIFADILGGQKNRHVVQVKSTVTNGTAHPTHERSYFKDDEQTAYLRPDTRTGTVWHELGHWLEHTVPGAYSVAKAFVDERTEGSSERHLDEIDPTRPGYEKWEKAKAGGFEEPYIGKDYQDGTEVVSMGMQMLIEDPVRLYTVDQEHFYLTIAMLLAGQQGGFPWGN